MRYRASLLDGFEEVVYAVDSSGNQIVDSSGNSVILLLTANTWADILAAALGVPAGTTPKTFSATDALNLWSDVRAGRLVFRVAVIDSAQNLLDSFAGRRGLLVGLTDPWNNLVDSAIQFRKGLYKLALTDPWGNLSDTLRRFERDASGSPTMRLTSPTRRLSSAKVFIS